ncbi:MAG: Lrp/AsnC family transcriptional regulator [Actinomycetota bacterium]|jgi:Lrp/AsnC family leucine-responsive transcriptional regulator
MNCSVDDFDRALLARLESDARAPLAVLARQVGLKSSTAHDRLRRLERLGVVKGYQARLDPKALGLNVTALVEVSPLHPESPGDLPSRFASLPGVEACWGVAGEASYVLKVWAEDTAELETFLDGLRSGMRLNTRTTVILSTHFEGRGPAATLGRGGAGR